MIIRSRTKAYQKTPRSFLYNYSDSDRVWLCYINRHLQSCLTTLIAVIPHFVWFFRRKFPKIITAKIPFRPAHIVEGCSCTRDLLIGTAELNRALCEKDSEREQPEADVENILQPFRLHRLILPTARSRITNVQSMRQFFSLVSQTTILFPRQRNTF